MSQVCFFDVLPLGVFSNCEFRTQPQTERSVAKRCVAQGIAATHMALRLALISLPFILRLCNCLDSPWPPGALRLPTKGACGALPARWAT